MEDTIDQRWHKSSYSGANGGSCIEVAERHAPGVVGVRDTKEAHLGNARTVLRVPAGAWETFTSSLK